MLKHKIFDFALASYPRAREHFFHRIFANFNSSKEVWLSKKTNLFRGHLKKVEIDAFLEYRSKTNLEELYKQYQKHEIKLVSLSDLEYPKVLKEIYNPPFFLFFKGCLPGNEIPKIAVVGSRKATDYGRRVTREVTTHLSQRGVEIISGLALGLDSEAHLACLKAKGKTFAVLANGLDSVYPISNLNLAREILRTGGGLISEYPLGTPALKQHFPARNRIISGLTEGVLITEAGEHSGTLHTASFAIEQNRQVFAVPGPIYNPLSFGPNSLLKQGAKPVTVPSDILEDIGVKDPIQNGKYRPENDLEELIFKALECGPKHLDEIIRESKADQADVSQTITVLEIKGALIHTGGMIYATRI